MLQDTAFRESAKVEFRPNEAVGAPRGRALLVPAQALHGGNGAAVDHVFRAGDGAGAR